MTEALAVGVALCVGAYAAHRFMTWGSPQSRPKYAAYYLEAAREGVAVGTMLCATNIPLHIAADLPIRQAVVAHAATLSIAVGLRVLYRIATSDALDVESAWQRYEIKRKSIESKQN